MKLIINGYGEDTGDKLVRFKFSAESTTHKTTLELWGYKDEFVTFGEQLMGFPFMGNKDTELKIGFGDNAAYGLLLSVRLKDKAGHATLLVSTEEHGVQSAYFTDTVEIEALQRLAKSLLSTDFATSTELTWESGHANE